MSIELMNHVWKGFPGSGSELLMMLALADRADEDKGRLWPSVLTLAKKCRISESMARRLIRSLEAKGYVTVIGNHNGGAPGVTRHYELNVARLREEAAMDLGHITAKPKVPPKPKDGSNDPACMDATPSMDARDGLHGCTSTPGMDATQYINKQSHNTHQHLDGGSGVSDQAADLFSSNDTQPSSSSASQIENSAGNAARDTRNASSASPNSQSKRSKSAAARGSAAKKERSAKRVRSVDVSMVVIPDWLPADEWALFCAYRDTLKKGTWSPLAAQLIVNELTKLRAEGNDPVVVLHKSIRSGWADVFPLKAHEKTAQNAGKFTPGASSTRQSPHDQWAEINRSREMQAQQEYFNGEVIDVEPC